MERFKAFLRKLLFPRAIVFALSIPASAALLIYVFSFGHQDGALAYISYLLSAYALSIVCVRIPQWARGGGAQLHRNAYIHRYLTDVPFRTRVSLYSSLAINLLFAAMKLFFGVRYRSIWFGALAAYYSLLAGMRFLLLRHARRNAFGGALIRELKLCRLCGAIMLAMNLALAVVVVLVVWKNEGFEYPGYWIYVVAMYAFYNVITATVHLIHQKGMRSPVVSAATAIKLAAALVSMLALETAMLSQFSAQGDLGFRRMMTAVTGGCVCLAVLGMAVLMMAASTKQLENLSAQRASL